VKRRWIDLELSSHGEEGQPPASPRRSDPFTEGLSPREGVEAQEVDDPGQESDGGLGPVLLPVDERAVVGAQPAGRFLLRDPEVYPAFPEMLTECLRVFGVTLWFQVGSWSAKDETGKRQRRGVASDVLQE
jgi:hypothetical protein